MVKTPQQPRQPYQPRPRQLPQPRQRSPQARQLTQQRPQQQQHLTREQKRKLAFKALHLTEASDYPVVEPITMADQAEAATVMEGLCQEQWESDHDSDTLTQSSGKSIRPLLDDSRVVSLTRDQVKARQSPWDLDSEELNPASWKLVKSKKRPVSSWNLAQSILNSKRPVKERLGEPNTYASKLKGPVPGPSAKPLGHLQNLKFLKKSSNRVRR
jgi:hypothetical protein